MYTVAVCDDEKRVTEEVKGLILQWNPTIRVDCFTSGEALLTHYYHYQAIFLDIDMGGINGIETGKRIREIDRETKIVFLTAYRDYVAGAFGVHAFQYLLKPVECRMLESVLDEIFRYVKSPAEQVILDFQTVNGLVCLPAEQIYFFEYENRKIRLVTDREEYFMVDRISSVGRRMEPFGFSMPHQSFVVNMFHVKNVKNTRIQLDNGLEVPLAQKKQKAWKQELLGYLSRRLEEGSV